MRTFLEVAMQHLDWSLGESGCWSIDEKGQIYIPDTEVAWCTVVCPDGEEFDWLEPEYDCGNSPSLEKCISEYGEDGEYAVYWRKNSIIMIDFKGEQFAPEEYGESWQTDTYEVKDGEVIDDTVEVAY